MSRIFNIKVVEQSEARFTIKESYLFIFIGLLFILQLIVGVYSWSKIRKISSENLKLRQDNEVITGDNQTLKAGIGLVEQSNTDLQDRLNNLMRYPENRLRAIGINVEKKKIRRLKITGISWEDREIKYSLISAFLTPEVSDLGNYRRYVSTTNPNYLIFEFEVRDLRNGGETKGLDPYKYLLMKTEDADFAPFIKKNISINPQESLVYYTGFFVDPARENFLLRMGIPEKPIEYEVDFTNSRVEQLFGVLKLEGGFSPEYFEYQSPTLLVKSNLGGYDLIDENL